MHEFHIVALHLTIQHTPTGPAWIKREIICSLDVKTTELEKPIVAIVIIPVLKL